MADGRVRPILGALHEAVLHRVAPAIPDVRRVVGLVADVALPGAALPDPALASGGVARAQRPGGKPAREARLDEAPAGGGVGVALGQRPDGVEMVGQHHPGVDPERPLGPRRPHRLAQRPDLRHEEPAAPLGEGQREEDRGPGHAGAEVARHGARLPAAA